MPTVLISQMVLWWVRPSFVCHGALTMFQINIKITTVLITLRPVTIVVFFNTLSVLSCSFFSCLKLMCLLEMNIL